MVLNANQFEQVTIVGQLDLNLSNKGIISGKVSDSQSGDLVAGTAVKLDTPAGSKVPSFIAAGITDEAIGYVIYVTKGATSLAGDRIQVALSIIAPIMYMESAAAIAAQARVEDVGDGTVQTLAASKQRGIALDPASGAGELIRVIITNQPALA